VHVLRLRAVGPRPVAQHAPGEGVVPIGVANRRSAQPEEAAVGALVEVGEHDQRPLEALGPVVGHQVYGVGVGAGGSRRLAPSQVGAQARERHRAARGPLLLLVGARQAPQRLHVVQPPRGVAPGAHRREQALQVQHLVEHLGGREVGHALAQGDQRVDEGHVRPRPRASRSGRR